MTKPIGISRSQRQEARAAATVGARRHAGSGNGHYNKNDASNRRSDRHSFHIECKGRASDQAKQITIKLADLADVERNAGLAGKSPVLHLEIGGRDYWLMPQWVVEELLDGG
jgi:hypothetical protein